MKAPPKKQLELLLYQPQIPQNTGNIVRSCAVTGSRLRLIPPLGFDISSKQLKRAGLDYWEGVDVQVLEEPESYLQENWQRCFFFSSKAKKHYTEVNYPEDAILVFGSETTGLPPSWHQDYASQFVTLPMVEDQRCLNLATSAGIALFEAWRQNQFFGAKRPS